MGRASKHIPGFLQDKGKIRARGSLKECFLKALCKEENMSYFICVLHVDCTDLYLLKISEKEEKNGP